jgi:GTP cyclohydrolase II
MFAYIDPSIRARLAEEGKLIRIDAHGKAVDVDATSEDSDLTLNVLGPIPMQVSLGGGGAVAEFQWYAFVRHTELAKANEIADALTRRGDERLFSILSSAMSVNSALVWGQPAEADRPLVRVHSCCLTGDVFGSRRCDCGPQLDAAFRRICSDPAGGIVIYMSGHEGRGIGLWAKAITYLLQDGGQNTYQANRSLGLPDDSRDFSDAAAMLLHLLGGDRPIRLMSNNPKKLADLRARGLAHIDTEKHLVGVNDTNRRYLRAKAGWGHGIDDDDLQD